MQAIGDVGKPAPSAARSAIGDGVWRQYFAAFNDLFDPADLATPGSDFTDEMTCGNRSPSRGEDEIDAMNSAPAVRSSPGAPRATALHLARAIVRRAERSALRPRRAQSAALNYLIAVDHLFVTAARSTLWAAIYYGCRERRAEALFLLIISDIFAR